MKKFQTGGTRYDKIGPMNRSDPKNHMLESRVSCQEKLTCGESEKSTERREVDQPRNHQRRNQQKEPKGGTLATVNQMPCPELQERRGQQIFTI